MRRSGEKTLFLGEVWKLFGGRTVSGVVLKSLENSKWESGGGRSARTEGWRRGGGRGDVWMRKSKSLFTGV